MVLSTGAEMLAEYQQMQVLNEIRDVVRRLDRTNLDQMQAHLTTAGQTISVYSVGTSTWPLTDQERLVVC